MKFFSLEGFPLSLFLSINIAIAKVANIYQKTSLLVRLGMIEHHYSIFLNISSSDRVLQ